MLTNMWEFVIMYTETASREFFVYFYKLKKGLMNPGRLYHLWMLTDNIISKSRKYKSYIKFTENYFIIRLAIFKHMLKIKLNHTREELRMAGYKGEFKLIEENLFKINIENITYLDKLSDYGKLICEIKEIIYELDYIDINVD